MVDMRKFRDPAAGKPRHNDGRHPEIIRRFVTHRLFPGWAREMALRMRPLVGGEVTCVAITTFWNAGRHHSVAAALVLQHVAAMHGLKDDGYSGILEMGAPKKLWNKYFKNAKILAG